MSDQGFAIEKPRNTKIWSLLEFNLVYNSSHNTIRIRVNISQYMIYIMARRLRVMLSET